MKKKSFFITLFAAILTGIAVITSCSDDDESGIVGTWRTNHYDNSGSGYGSLYVMFCSDGTLYEFEECSTHGYHAEKAKYTYSESSGKLRLVFEEYGDTYTETLDVEISGNKMIVDVGSGSHEEYKRVSSPVSKSELERYYLDDYGSR